MKTIALIFALFLVSTQASADEFECEPGRSGWAVVNKMTQKIIRSGSKDFAFKQDCERSTELANRKNSPKILCTPYYGGVALTNYAGNNLSPRGAVFHEVNYCLRAIESIQNDLLCVPNGEDLYLLVDLKADKYVFRYNHYRLLSNCIAGAASASRQDNYLCASHANQNEEIHYHIYDRATGEMLTPTSYGKISSCVADLRNR